MFGTDNQFVEVAKDKFFGFLEGRGLVASGSGTRSDYSEVGYSDPDGQDAVAGTTSICEDYVAKETRYWIRKDCIQTATARGQEMMRPPIGELPELAREFAGHLCQEVGMCAEVMITAYTVYAQCVEGLECDDDLYRPRPQDVDWFKDKEIERLGLGPDDLETDGYGDRSSIQ